MTDTHNQLTVSVREVRVVVERCLMLLGVPRGALPNVREFVLDAEVRDGRGLAALDETFVYEQVWVQPPRPVECDGNLRVDGAGTSSMFLAMPLAALALAAHADGRQVVVSDMRSAHLLDALAATSRRVLGRSVAAVAVADPDEKPSWRLDVAPVATTDVQSDPLVEAAGSAELAAAIREGIPTSAALWWRLFHRSNDALTEDTPLSRAHAGAMPTDVADVDAVARHDLDADYVPSQRGTVLTKPPIPRTTTSRRRHDV
jgi:hypothetical protein